MFDGRFAAFLATVTGTLVIAAVVSIAAGDLSRRGCGRGQCVEGRLDLRVLISGREGELFERGVAVGHRRREVVEVAVELRHQVVGASWLARCVLAVGAGGVDAVEALR